MPEREIYLEYRRIGAQLKVSAIDSLTGVEVSTFGPASVGEQELGRLAVRKLRRRLAQIDAEGRSRQR